MKGNDMVRQLKKLNQTVVGLHGIGVYAWSDGVNTHLSQCFWRIEVLADGAQAAKYSLLPSQPFGAYHGVGCDLLTVIVPLAVIVK